jgi:hypothetical protein
MRNGTVAADARRRSAGPAPRYATAAALAAIGLICLVAAAGCSSSARPPASATPTTTRTTSATAASQPSVTPGAVTEPVSVPPTAPAPASPTAATGVPTLGQLAGAFARGEGFGQVKPSKIFNGGDPTGLVTGVAWSSWGGAQATGTGTAEYLAPDQTVAQGTEEPATVVAFDLGTCDGKLMYQAIEWYFPQHGQSFNPNTYQDICTGSYVGTP